MRAVAAAPVATSTASGDISGSVTTSRSAEPPIKVISTAGAACGTDWKPPRAACPKVAMPAPSHASQPAWWRLPGDAAASAGGAGQSAEAGSRVVPPACGAPGARDASNVTGSRLSMVGRIRGGPGRMPRSAQRWNSIRCAFSSGPGRSARWSRPTGTSASPSAATAPDASSAPPTPLSTAMRCQCNGSSAMKRPIPCSCPAGLGNARCTCQSSAATASADTR